MTEVQLHTTCVGFCVISGRMWRSQHWSTSYAAFPKYYKTTFQSIDPTHTHTHISNGKCQEAVSAVTTTGYRRGATHETLKRRTWWWGHLKVNVVFKRVVKSFKSRSCVCFLQIFVPQREACTFYFLLTGCIHLRCGVCLKTSQSCMSSSVGFFEHMKEMSIFNWLKWNKM